MLKLRILHAFILIVSASFAVPGRCVIEPVLQLLYQHVQAKDKRLWTCEEALKLAEECNPKIVVETGTCRGGMGNFAGDGCFTAIFGYWCKLNNAHMYSVDISSTSIQGAACAVRELDLTGSVDLVCSDSITFLEKFDKPIDFLYLDSYDYEIANPTPSQNHHLREIEVAYEKLSQNAVVMVDDCDLPGGGKCSLVVDYLFP